MSQIQVTCPDGHRINANARLQGKTRPCPKCQKPVVIPPPTIEQKLVFSAAELLDILGEATQIPVPPVAARTAAKLRKCPRCETRIKIATNVCDQCKCYVGPMSDYVERVYAGVKNGSV